MKKPRISTAVVVTVLVLGIFAFMSAQEANAAPKARVRVLSLTKTLPKGGTDVTFTLQAKEDLILYGILVDNTPTRGDCIVQDPGPPVICLESDFRIVSVRIAGSDFRPNQFPQDFAFSDGLAIREIIGFSPEFSFSDAEIPLDKGKKIELTFDTENIVNDVSLRVTFGVIGGSAKLSILPGPDDDDDDD